MTVVLYHHPYSRAANVVWMLEEVGAPYELRYVDLMKGEQKAPAFLALNSMGKLPVITDGDTVVSESAAVGLYLADRYAPGTLAPALDDPARGTYLRWSLFAPSVLEPGSLAKARGWTFEASNAGWGEHTTMLDAMEAALQHPPFLLGARFTMADVIFGGTVDYMLRFDMLEKRPAFTGYVERLAARPAYQRAQEVNARVRAEHGLQ
ncbi:MAG: glutathione S-transferase family protein [Polyangiaceae bacterium]|nr:glutathione S-transferase family protein [Polyangiaceae bacterium]